VDHAVGTEKTNMQNTRTRLSGVFLVTLMLLLPALPALAASETGNWSCAVGSHVYTKIRYTNGYSQSYIQGTIDTNTLTHATVSTWVNRYHQPQAGGAAYYELREKTSTMSNTYSWPGCE
jgi:hypothetical protein